MSLGYSELFAAHCVARSYGVESPFPRLRGVTFTTFAARDEACSTLVKREEKLRKDAAMADELEVTATVSHSAKYWLQNRPAGLCSKWQLNRCSGCVPDRYEWGGRRNGIVQLVELQRYFLGGCFAAVRWTLRAAFDFLQTLPPRV